MLPTFDNGRVRPVANFRDCHFHCSPNKIVSRCYVAYVRITLLQFVKVVVDVVLETEIPARISCDVFHVTPADL